VLSFYATEIKVDQVIAEEGYLLSRKVRAPQGKVLGNTQWG